MHKSEFLSNKMKSKNATRPQKSLFIFTFLIFAIILLTQILYAYVSSEKSGDLEYRAEGAFFTKISSDSIEFRCIQPNSTISLKNNSDKMKQVTITCSNISPRLYAISLEKNDEVIKTGNHDLTVRIKLPAGSARTISISPRQKDLTKFTFAVLGDSRHGHNIHKKILNEIAKSNALFAINLGDIVNKGKKEEYLEFFNVIDSFPLPYYVVPGNHESKARGGFDRFLQQVSPTNYSFDLGEFHFVMLDNSRGIIGEDGFKWLQKDLKGHKNNFIFMHTPPFVPSNREKVKNHIMYSQEEISKFMSLVEKNNVKAVFAGHVHAYLYQKKNGVDYYISGCAGASPYLPPEEGGYPHYLLVDVEGDKYKVAVHKVNQ